MKYNPENITLISLNFKAVPVPFLVFLMKEVFVLETYLLYAFSNIPFHNTLDEL